MIVMAKAVMKEELVIVMAKAVMKEELVKQAAAEELVVVEVKEEGCWRRWRR